MNAIKVNRYGDASVLELAMDEPKPQPGPDQVLVKIQAAGVNYVDTYHRRGYYPVPLPFTPGLEASGVVEDTGPDVREFRPGDRVAYNGQLGSYADYAAVDAAKLIHLPVEMSFEMGASFLLQGMTAHYLLHDYKTLKPGDTVLVHAASGGVGRLLVQWARHLGATVIGTVSTEEKAAVAREAGADHVIIYSSKSFAVEARRITGGAGVSLILDGVGRTTFPGDMDAVATFGHIVLFGAASGPADPVVPNSLMPRSITVSGGTLFNFVASREDLLRRSKAVLDGLKEGWLTLRIFRALPLAEAAEAHRLLESRKSTGKIVLTTAG